jgi:hypothetical protein
VEAPHAIGVIRRSSRAVLVAAALVAGCASLPPARPIDGAATVAGTWRGRMSGPLGNAPVLLTIQDDSSYHGMLFVEPTYTEFAGAITVTRLAPARYQGTNGIGRVTLHQDGDRRVLRFVADGGGGGAELTPAQ